MPAGPTTARAGLTLLEMGMALALFGVVMFAVMQALLATRAYVDQDAVATDLVIESQRVLDELITDLGNSAWYFPADLDGANGRRPPDGTDTAELALLQAPAADRGLRYYPYVLAQTATGVNTGQLAAWTRVAADVLDPDSLPGVLPPEHRQPSREVVFLRTRTGPTASAPAALSMPRIDFDSAPLPMSTYSTNRDGIAVNALMLRTDGTGAITDLPVVWESAVANPSAAQLIDGDYLREYSYVVVPDASTGKGRLERRYRNGLTGAVTVDRVLSVNVDRLVIDTYRTATGLGVNQVRIELFLSRERPDAPGEYQTQRMQITAAMRGIAVPGSDSSLVTGPAGAIPLP